jgi:hypothetical protein
MTHLRKLFDADFAHVLHVARPLTIEFEDWPRLEVLVRVHMDVTANARYVSCFVPHHPAPVPVFLVVLQQLDQFLNSADDANLSAGAGSPVHPAALAFTGRVYFYSEADDPGSEFDQLQREARKKGISLILRGRAYAKEHAGRTGGPKAPSGLAKADGPAA